MHYSFHKERRELKAGKTVLFENNRDLVFGTVKSNNYKDGLVVELSDGRSISFTDVNFNPGWRDQDGKTGFYLKWANPIPNLTDAEVINYVSILDKMKDAPIFVHVDSVTDAKIVGRFVTKTPLSTEEVDNDQIILVPSENDPIEPLTLKDVDGVRIFDLPAIIYTYQHSFKKQEEKEVQSVRGINNSNPVAAGDVIAFDTFVMNYEDGELTTTPTPTCSLTQPGLQVVKHNASTDDIRSLLLLNTRQEDLLTNDDTSESQYADRVLFRTTNAMFKSADHIEQEVFAAELRTQPDEAIVLWLNSDRRVGDTDPSILGSTGYLLNIMDDVQSYIDDHDVSEGLWLMKKPTFTSWYSYEGEYDCCLDAEYAPATHEDIKRVIGEDFDLAADILDALDGRELEVYEDGLVDHFIAQAAINHEAELAGQTPHMES